MHALMKRINKSQCLLAFVFRTRDNRHLTHLSALDLQRSLASPA
jgi:hypothetical protein